MYRLTPKGIEELTRLTLTFLKIRMAEYESIKTEIATLSKQIKAIMPELNNELKLTEALKKIV